MRNISGINSMHFHYFLVVRKIKAGGKSLVFLLDLQKWGILYCYIFEECIMHNILVTL